MDPNRRDHVTIVTEKESDVRCQEAYKMIDRHSQKRDISKGGSLPVVTVYAMSVLTNVSLLWVTNI